MIRNASLSRETQGGRTCRPLIPLIPPTSPEVSLGSQSETTALNPKLPCMCIEGIGNTLRIAVIQLPRPRNLTPKNQAPSKTRHQLESAAQERLLRVPVLTSSNLQQVVGGAVPVERTVGGAVVQQDAI